MEALVKPWSLYPYTNVARSTAHNHDYDDNKDDDDYDGNNDNSILRNLHNTVSLNDPKLIKAIWEFIVNVI